MKRRTRTIAVLAALGALALAGCSSSYDSPGGGNPSPTDPVTTSAPSSAGAGYAGY